MLGNGRTQERGVTADHDQADHHSAHHTYTVEVTDSQGKTHKGTGRSHAEARRNAEKAADEANRPPVRPNWF